jgi:hypothetical protein
VTFSTTRFVDLAIAHGDFLVRKPTRLWIPFKRFIRLIHLDRVIKRLGRRTDDLGDFATELDIMLILLLARRVVCAVHTACGVTRNQAGHQPDAIHDLFPHRQRWGECHRFAYMRAAQIGAILQRRKELVI